MTEIWKDIPGFESSIQVSNYGNVKRVSDGYIYAKRDDGCDYLMTHLRKDNKDVYFRNHILVAEMFIPYTGLNPDGSPIEGKPEVNHKDSDKGNNFVNNLEWCDRKYNCSRSDRIAKYSNSRKHSPIKKIECIETKEIFNSVADAARNYRLSASSLAKAASPDYKQKTSGGYHWKYIN